MIYGWNPGLHCHYLRRGQPRHARAFWPARLVRLVQRRVARLAEENDAVELDHHVGGQRRGQRQQRGAERHQHVHERLRHVGKRDAKLVALVKVAFDGAA